MRPRISMRGFVRPSVCLYIRMSVHPAIVKTAKNGPKSLKKHCGHILIHHGRIFLPARACFEENPCIFQISDTCRIR